MWVIISINFRAPTIASENPIGHFIYRSDDFGRVIFDHIKLIVCFFILNNRFLNGSDSSTSCCAFVLGGALVVSQTLQILNHFLTGHGTPPTLPHWLPPEPTSDGLLGQKLL